MRSGFVLWLCVWFSACRAGSVGPLPENETSATDSTDATTPSATGEDASNDTGTGPGSDVTPVPGTAGTLVRKLGKTSFLIGLGPNESAYPATGQLDIRYIYLVGASNPNDAWPKWNSPDGQFVTMTAQSAVQHGATPMFDVYELAALGDGEFTIVTDASYMTRFWADITLLGQKLAAFDAPALVHIEPDFWGYAQQSSPGGDPTAFAAQVTVASACTDLPNDLTGLGRCVLRIIKTAAPKTLVGFHGSGWAAYDNAGNPDAAAVGRFLTQISGGGADFVVTDFLDRDAGCFEAKPAEYDCGRGGTTGWYWDETNATSPNFHEHLAWSRELVVSMGLPIMWWQTPLGVPSATAGGTPSHYRDNRVHYVFSHLQEYVDAGGFGVAFGAGASGQTTVSTDGGQFAAALSVYNLTPVALY